MPKIQLTIQKCDDCPFSKAEREYTADSWDHEFKILCTKAGNRVVYYTDSAKQDVPEWCPIIVKD